METPFKIGTRVCILEDRDSERVGLNSLRGTCGFVRGFRTETRTYGNNSDSVRVYLVGCLAEGQDFPWFIIVDEKNLAAIPPTL